MSMTFIKIRKSEIGKLKTNTLFVWSYLSSLPQEKTHKVSNGYFMDIMNINYCTASLCIKDLVELGYISTATGYVAGDTSVITQRSIKVLKSYEEEKFFYYDTRWIREFGLSSNCALVYSIIFSQYKYTGETSIKNFCAKALANTAKLSYPTVIKCLKELKFIGLISTRKGGKGEGTICDIHLVDEGDKGLEEIAENIINSDKFDIAELKSKKAQKDKAIVKFLRRQYRNIKNRYIYSNPLKLYEALFRSLDRIGELRDSWGVSIVKDKRGYILA